jgi:hypothetical protein
MAPVDAQPLFEAALAVAKPQYSVITRAQLLRLGLTDDAVRHWLRIGRLHRIWPGVYALGRLGLTRNGYFLAALLTCGEEACLCHQSAGVHYEILRHRRGPIHVSAPPNVSARRRNITVHRRADILKVQRHKGIRIASPVDTLVDLATCLDAQRHERAVNEAHARRASPSLRPSATARAAGSTSSGPSQG